jgi:hypothetical protein
MKAGSRESSAEVERANVSCKYEKFHRFNFEARCDFHCYTCMKHLRTHPRVLTHTSQLASCKRGFMNGSCESKFIISY